MKSIAFELSEFLRQAMRRATIRPVVHLAAANDELLAAIGRRLDNGARRVIIHLPYDQGGLLDKLYQQAKVESVEYGETIDVAAVCTPKVIGQLGPLVEGWRPHREPWED